MPEQHNTEANIVKEANEALGEMMKAIWLADSLAWLWKDFDLNEVDPKDLIHWMNMNEAAFGELKRLCSVAMEEEGAVSDALRKLEKLEGVEHG